MQLPAVFQTVRSLPQQHRLLLLNRLCRIVPARLLLTRSGSFWTHTLFYFGSGSQDFVWCAGVGLWLSALACYSFPQGISRMCAGHETPQDSGSKGSSGQDSCCKAS
jgi:hypothetical protein